MSAVVADRGDPDVGAERRAVSRPLRRSDQGKCRLVHGLHGLCGYRSRAPNSGLFAPLGG